MTIGEPDPSPQGEDEGAAGSEDTGLPASTFDTVRRGFAPDQVAEYLQRVATLVLSLEARLGEMTSELLEAKRLRSDVRLEASRILALAREEAKRFIAEADAEAERIREDARTLERESQIRAGRLIIEAREEADRAESHLAVVRGGMLDTFRDIRERTITALGEVEALIESGATPDRLVIVDEAGELADDGAPGLGADDAGGLAPA